MEIKLKEGILFLLLITTTMEHPIAQSLSLCVTKSTVGYGIKVGYGIEKKKLAIEGGIKYHVNRIDYYNPESASFANQYYAQNFIQHFGLFGSLRRTFYEINDRTNLYGIIKLDASFLGTKSYSYQTFNRTDSFGLLIHYRFDSAGDPILVVEGAGGIGIRSKLGKNASIFFEAGVGVTTNFLPGNYKSSVGQHIFTQWNSQRVFDPNIFAQLGIQFPINRQK